MHDTPRASCRGRSSGAASAFSASCRPRGRRGGRRSPIAVSARPGSIRLRCRLVGANRRSVSKTDWISAPRSAPATALLPTCAETILAVRARISVRSMLFRRASWSSVLTVPLKRRSDRRTSSAADAARTILAALRADKRTDAADQRGANECLVILRKAQSLGAFVLGHCTNPGRALAGPRAGAARAACTSLLDWPAAP